jgi:Zn-dependent M28 family amino/carboxypeptidase
MAIAKAIATNNIPVKRSILFVAFGSEEQALVGSKAYVKNPYMPLEKSILINLDGVGIGHSIGANAGRNYPGLWSVVDEANKNFVHRTLTTNNFSNLGRPRLDASIFLTAGVPSLSFYTYGSTNYYHIPQDDIKIIKPEIMEDLARLLFLSIVNMANSDTPLR